MDFVPYHYCPPSPPIDPGTPMKIEAITVCVGYSDFLSETVRHNAGLFDAWHVVTTPDDKDTIELCRRRNLHAIVTTEFSRGNSNKRPFNKGRGISLGLNFVHEASWVVHLDADMVLPSRFRQMFELADPDPTCLYGIDRVCLLNWEEWKRLESSGYLNDQHGYHLCANFPQPARVGTRVIRGKHGYTPIGFFQMWHYGDGIHSGMRFRDYPDTNDDAAHSDIKFALQWDRRNRVLLPEVIGVHLESSPSAMGANWNGRTTPRFEAPKGK